MAAPGPAIPENYFQSVTTTAEGIFESQNFGDQKFLFVVKILSLLPRDTKISNDLMERTHKVFLAHIENWDMYTAGAYLKVLNEPSWAASIPDDFYLDAVKSIRDVAKDQCIQWNGSGAEGTLDLLKRIPQNTKTPDDHFLQGLETIRNKLLYNLGGTVQDNTSLLELLPHFPSNTRVPEDYFLVAVEAAHKTILECIKKDMVAESRFAAMALPLLKPYTKIPKGYFDTINYLLRGNKLYTAKYIRDKIADL